MGIAVDYSFERPSDAQLRAADVAGVIRYLTGAGKAITLAEFNEHLAAGRWVAFVTEGTTTDIVGGRAAGVVRAQAAVAALKALGLPASQPVYYAVDESVKNPEDAVAYFEGIASVVPVSAIGNYAEGAVCELLAELDLATFPWQTESTGFPGNATTLPITCLQQRFNASPIPGTDLDVICKPDVGQYPRPLAPPVANVPQEVIMGLPTNCSDHGAINSQIREWWNLYRTDPMTGEDQAACLYAFYVSTAQGGFGGNPDALQAHIVDDAKAKGTLKPEFASAV